AGRVRLTGVLGLDSRPRGHVVVGATHHDHPYRFRVLPRNPLDRNASRTGSATRKPSWFARLAGTFEARQIISFRVCRLQTLAHTAHPDPSSDHRRRLVTRARPLRSGPAVG